MFAFELIDNTFKTVIFDTPRERVTQSRVVPKLREITVAQQDEYGMVDGWL